MQDNNKIIHLNCTIKNDIDLLKKDLCAKYFENNRYKILNIFNKKEFKLHLAKLKLINKSINKKIKKLEKFKSLAKTTLNKEEYEEYIELLDIPHIFNPDIGKFCWSYDDLLKCPICGNRNHNFNKPEFADSISIAIISLQNQLVKAKDFLPTVKIGIPCCKCYYKIFPGDNEIKRLTINSIKSDFCYFSDFLSNEEKSCIYAFLDNNLKKLELSDLIEIKSLNNKLLPQFFNELKEVKNLNSKENCIILPKLLEKLKLLNNKTDSNYYSN